MRRLPISSASSKTLDKRIEVAEVACRALAEYLQTVIAGSPRNNAGATAGVSGGRAPPPGDGPDASGRSLRPLVGLPPRWRK